jgi:hypothetical protein
MLKIPYSKVFGLLNNSGKWTKRENRIFFQTDAEAIAAGMTKIVN